MAVDCGAQIPPLNKVRRPIRGSETGGERAREGDCVLRGSQGYDYKNTITNAIFFNMGARLARYTLNETYADWAVKAYDWMASLGHVDEDWNVYDGGHIDDNCTGIDKAQFSYNAAVLVQGTAFMYNYVSRTPSLLLEDEEDEEEEEEEEEEGDDSFASD